MSDKRSYQERPDQVKTPIDGDTSKHTYNVKPDSPKQGGISPNSHDRGKGGK